MKAADRIYNVVLWMAEAGLPGVPNEVWKGD